MSGHSLELNENDQVHRINLAVIGSFVGYLDLVNPVDQKSLKDGNIEKFLQELDQEI